jgi:hypothetical protein
LLSIRTLCPKKWLGRIGDDEERAVLAERLGAEPGAVLALLGQVDEDRRAASGHDLDLAHQVVDVDRRTAQREVAILCRARRGRLHQECQKRQKRQDVEPRAQHGGDPPDRE